MDEAKKDIENRAATGPPVRHNGYYIRRLRDGGENYQGTLEDARHVDVQPRAKPIKSTPLWVTPHWPKHCGRSYGARTTRYRHPGSDHAEVPMGAAEKSAETGQSTNPDPYGPIQSSVATTLVYTVLCIWCVSA
jgi:hypothetical protein